jgi:hypothetical protein
MDDTTMMILIVVLMYVMMTKSCGSREKFTNSWTPFLPKDKVDCGKVGKTKDDCCNCVQRYTPFGVQKAKDSCKGISCNDTFTADYGVPTQVVIPAAPQKVSKPCTGKVNKVGHKQHDNNCQGVYNALLKTNWTQERIDNWCKNMNGCTFGAQQATPKATTATAGSLSLAQLKGMNLRELCKKL